MHYLLKIASLLGLFITTYNVTLATTIIVAMTEDFTMLASDSRLTTLDPKTGVVEYSSACKIQRPGKVAFAMMGNYGVSADGSIFYRILARNLNNHQNVDHAIAESNREISLHLQGEIEQTTRGDSLKRIDAITTCIVIGSENSETFTKQVFFSYDHQSNSVRDSVKTFNILAGNSSMTIVKLGLDDSVWEANTKSRSFSSKEELMKFLEKLVLEQSLISEKKAPPVNIFMIDKHGTKSWLQRDMVCPE